MIRMEDTRHQSAIDDLLHGCLVDGETPKGWLQIVKFDEDTAITISYEPGEDWPIRRGWVRAKMDNRSSFIVHADGEVFGPDSPNSTFVSCVGLFSTPSFPADEAWIRVVDDTLHRGMHRYVVPSGDDARADDAFRLLDLVAALRDLPETAIIAGIGQGLDKLVEGAPAHWLELIGKGLMEFGRGGTHSQVHGNPKAPLHWHVSMSYAITTWLQWIHLPFALEDLEMARRIEA